jgi:2,4-dienoyl-CoA reductase-like NADH-dependent reductase (Old Yellow Enzyme family)
MSHTNLRTDRYAGPLENRVRFPLELVQAVAQIRIALA